MFCDVIRRAGRSTRYFDRLFLLKSVIIIKKHRKELSNLKEMRNDVKTIRIEAIQEVLPDQAVKGGKLAKACSDRQI